MDGKLCLYTVESDMSTAFGRHKGAVYRRFTALFEIRVLTVWLYQRLGHLEEVFVGVVLCDDFLG